VELYRLLREAQFKSDAPLQLQ